MFKKIIAISIVSAFVLSGCNATVDIGDNTTNDIILSVPEESKNSETSIVLSDNGITVNGDSASTNASSDVYIANDIIYYESGKDSSYGEGTEKDAHTKSEADAHTVIHIAKPGNYRLSGLITQGQVLVDLGDNAKDDPSAVVTLILDGVDISCTVAPAIFFYNVYECSKNTEESATANVDTSAAGANVVIANDSINTINGSYVARIYAPDTTDSLHKYDGAFYSRQSMNINSESNGTGVMHVNAENEGICSEMHLTVNGGNITITSQNDGINTNEDNVSVTTINGGGLTINAGLGEEGDGIDSNGFIVINGGAVLTSSCDKGPDGGIDADRDILINDGTVLACGNQNGAISSESNQAFMQISVRNAIPAGAAVKIMDGEKVLTEFTSIKSCTSLVLSAPSFEDGKMYALNVNGANTEYTVSGGFGPGGMGGMHPPIGGEAFERPEMHDNLFEIPEIPENLDEWLSSTEIPEDIREWIESMRDFIAPFNNRGGNMQPRENMQMPNA